jgi:hypothetical protein
MYDDPIDEWGQLHERFAFCVYARSYGCMSWSCVPLNAYRFPFLLGLLTLILIPSPPLYSSWRPAGTLPPPRFSGPLPINAQAVSPQPYASSFVIIMKPPDKFQHSTSASCSIELIHCHLQVKNQVMRPSAPSTPACSRRCLCQLPARYPF